eukprot:3090690-Amphidinium_carterae.2
MILFGSLSSKKRLDQVNQSHEPFKAALGGCARPRSTKKGRATSKESFVALEVYPRKKCSGRLFLEKNPPSSRV